MRTVVENTTERIYIETIVPQSSIAITLEVVDSAGSVSVSTPMTEVGSSGIYFADISLNTPGDYIIRFVSASISQIDSEHLRIIPVTQDITGVLAQIQADIVALAASIDEVDTCVELIKKGFFNRMKIDETTNELILYDDDSTTELLKFGLKDINGVDTSINIFEILKGQI